MIHEIIYLINERPNQFKFVISFDSYTRNYCSGRCEALYFVYGHNVVRLKSILDFASLLNYFNFLFYLFWTTASLSDENG